MTVIPTKEYPMSANVFNVCLNQVNFFRRLSKHTSSSSVISSSR